ACRPYCDVVGISKRQTPNARTEATQCFLRVADGADSPAQATRAKVRAPLNHIVMMNVQQNTHRNVMHFHAILTKWCASLTAFPYGNPYF
ncbi:MAG: hypothetical protein VW935_07895, partial [Novosphingobium sp.]